MFKGLLCTYKYFANSSEWGRGGGSRSPPPQLRSDLLLNHQHKCSFVVKYKTCRVWLPKLRFTIVFFFYFHLVSFLNRPIQKSSVAIFICILKRANAEERVNIFWYEFSSELTPILVLSSLPFYQYTLILFTSIKKT